MDAVTPKKGDAETTALDTPYVVKFHNYFQLSEVQPVFRFVHPNPATIIDNTR